MSAHTPPSSAILGEFDFIVIPAMAIHTHLTLVPVPDLPGRPASDIDRYKDKQCSLYEVLAEHLPKEAKLAFRVIDETEVAINPELQLVFYDNVISGKVVNGLVYRHSIRLQSFNRPAWEDTLVKWINTWVASTDQQLYKPPQITLA